jgi:hypothetical protein
MLLVELVGRYTLLAAKVKVDVKVMGEREGRRGGGVTSAAV